MMIKAAKLEWTGSGVGQEHGWSRPEQSKCRAEAGAGQEQGRNRNRAGADLSGVKPSRAERGQELGRSWAGTGEELGMCWIGA